jgi:hypothetical protein
MTCTLVLTRRSPVDTPPSGYILFDVPDGVEPIDRSFLEQSGHSVLVCRGPVAKELCPILSGEGCSLAVEAQGIIFELDLDRPQHRAILAKYEDSLRGDIPIRAVVRPGQEHQYRDLLAGLKVWTHQPVAGDLDGFVAEVEAADL